MNGMSEDTSKESTNEEAAIKDIQEIGMKALADSVADALSSQVGGEFDVKLTKLEQLPSNAGHGRELVLHFQVSDKSWIHRLKWVRDRRDQNSAN